MFPVIQIFKYHENFQEFGHLKSVFLKLFEPRHTKQINMLKIILN